MQRNIVIVKNVLEITEIWMKIVYNLIGFVPHSNLGDNGGKLQKHNDWEVTDGEERNG